MLMERHKNYSNQLYKSRYQKKKKKKERTRKDRRWGWNVDCKIMVGLSWRRRTQMK